MALKPTASLSLACGITFVHFVSAYTRVPLLPIFVIAQGGSASQAGAIVGAHMCVAALTCIPLGFVSDHWGRLRVVFAGALISAMTTFGLACTSKVWALGLIYATAGLGVSAFLPAMTSFVGDVARPGAIARAYGFFTTALYAAFGFGPILGGLGGQRLGVRSTLFTAAAALLVATLSVVFLAAGAPPRLRALRATGERGRVATPRVVATWVATGAASAALGSVTVFFPLLARDRGLGPAATGLVLGVQALVNATARFPTGRLLDRTRRRQPYILGGSLMAALMIAVLPFVRRVGSFAFVAGVLGVALAVAMMAIATTLAEITSPATRGAASGGYFMSIYIGIAAAAFGIGPLIARWGYPVAFSAGGAGIAVVAVCAAILALRDRS